MASSVRPITSGYMHYFREWEEKVSIQFFFWECLIITEEEEEGGAKHYYVMFPIPVSIFD